MVEHTFMVVDDLEAEAGGSLSEFKASPSQLGLHRRSSLKNKTLTTTTTTAKKCYMMYLLGRQIIDKYIKFLQ